MKNVESYNWEFNEIIRRICCLLWEVNTFCVQVVSFFFFLRINGGGKDSQISIRITSKEIPGLD